MPLNRDIPQFGCAGPRTSGMKNGATRKSLFPTLVSHAYVPSGRGWEGVLLSNHLDNDCSPFGSAKWFVNGLAPPFMPIGAPDWISPITLYCHPPISCPRKPVVFPPNRFPGPNGSLYRPVIATRCGRSVLEMSLNGWVSHAFSSAVA